jgi:hypothetical protein
MKVVIPSLGDITSVSQYRPHPYRTICLKIGASDLMYAGGGCTILPIRQSKKILYHGVVRSSLNDNEMQNDLYATIIYLPIA